jgi:CheY-like chemotaxis protein
MPVNGANGSAKQAILVVEDEALIRLMLVEALEDDGYPVFEADNAAAAVALLQGNGTIAMVVSDVRMPGDMDGIGLAYWIRANRPGTKILLASGYVSAADQRDLAASIDGFVGKPYRIPDMIRQIAGLLQA